MTNAAPTELRRIPGVGPSIEGDLLAIGVRRVSDLVGRDPRELYARVCAHQGAQVDRCLLYVMRCAVYFAETADPDPALLKWWAWKARAHPGERG
jgi:Pathogenicity locus